MAAPYFQPAGVMRFIPTPHASGAWSQDELHIAPALGLIAHLVEADRDARRGDDLQFIRLSCDILGTIQMAAFDVTVEVVRAGRTIELVEARMTQNGRIGVIARAWLAARYDTADLAGSALAPMPAPEELEAWDPTTVWPGGMIRSLEVRRGLREPGSGAAWLSTAVPILADTSISPTAAMLGLVDVANGMAVRSSPDDVAFPNLDLTAHLFRAPAGGWVGVDTTVSYGRQGAGLTQSVLHDVDGPVGTIAQTLTVRPGRR